MTSALQDTRQISFAGVRWALIARTLVLCLLASPSVFGQQSSTPRVPEGKEKPPQAPIAANMQLARLNQRFEDAFAAKDFAKAEAAMRELQQLQPENIALRYNLALTIAAQFAPDTNRDEEAAMLIASAIDGGFSDARRIVRDPMLTRVREQPVLQTKLRNWQAVHQQQRTQLLARAQQEFPSCTHRVTLDDLRIELITHLPQDEAGLIAGELEKVHSYLSEHVLPTDAELGIDAMIAQAVQNDAGAKALFDHPWSIIIIPNAADYNMWAKRMFGGANPNHGAAGVIGGLYDHASKRLVAIDAGSTLRHEFAHVLHQRLCERVGQTHPVWMLEGVATLVEDMDPKGNDFVPATSWRTNAAFRMAGASVLPTLKSLSSLEPAVFGGSRALANYAATRSAFLWATQNDILHPWFVMYMTNREMGIAHDATGFASFFAVATSRVQGDAKPLTSERDLEKALRAFARSHKSVPEETRRGSPSLGVTVEGKQGDGLVIVDIAPRWKTALRRGDVIIKVGSHSVRDIAELLRVLPITCEGLMDVADLQVSVIVRRQGELVSLEATIKRAE